MSAPAGRWPAVRVVIEPDPHTDPRIRIGVVEIEGERLVLSAAEFAIWNGLYRRRGQFVALASLRGAAEACTGKSYGAWAAGTARVHLCRLREKLADQGLPFAIETIRTVGHRLVVLT